MIERVLRPINPARRRYRWPLKFVLMVLVTVVVLFPRVDLLFRDINHWRHVNELPDPNSPALKPLADELAPLLAHQPKGRKALHIVQMFVQRKLPYAWDWDTWGVADYIPTVDEALAAGREDCDGRAVVAAALLRRFGYDARLVSDLSHVWVWTPEGQTMSPMHTASGRSVIDADAAGSHLDLATLLDPRSILVDHPTSLGYAVAVFPLWREAILVAAAWILLLGSAPGGRRAAVSLVLAVAGVLVLKATCWNPFARDVAGAWMGIGLMAGAVGILMWLRDRPRGTLAAEVTPDNPVTPVAPAPMGTSAIGPAAIVAERANTAHSSPVPGGSGGRSVA